MTVRPRLPHPSAPYPARLPPDHDAGPADTRVTVWVRTTYLHASGYRATKWMLVDHYTTRGDNEHDAQEHNDLIGLNEAIIALYRSDCGCLVWTTHWLRNSDEPNQHQWAPWDAPHHHYPLERSHT